MRFWEFPICPYRVFPNSRRASAACGSVLRHVSIVCFSVSCRVSVITSSVSSLKPRQFTYIPRSLTSPEKKLHTCISAPLNLALFQPYLRAGRARADPFFRPSAAVAPVCLSVLWLRRRLRFAICMCSCMVCARGRIRPSFVFGCALGVYACVRLRLLSAQCCIGG